MVGKMINWTEEIKNMCAKRGWSIRKLAGDVGVSQTYMQDVANGKVPPSPLLKIKLAGRFGWDKTTELLCEILPADAAEAWKQWDDNTTKALGDAAEKKVDAREAAQKSAKKRVAIKKA